MICYHNSTRQKIWRDQLDIHRVKRELIQVIDYADQVIEEITAGICHAVITSLVRLGSRAHSEERAADLRARHIEERLRKLVESLVNKEFPVEEGRIPTIKYWNRRNSTRVRCRICKWKIDPYKHPQPIGEVWKVCPECGSHDLTTTSYPAHYHLEVALNYRKPSKWLKEV